VSYSITIGERVPGEEGGYNALRVEGAPLAPRFDGDELTGTSNERFPAYLTFREFVEQTGTRRLFSLLMPSHPGSAPLYPSHRSAIRRALHAYRRKHEGAVPGWHPGQDPLLARLMWFYFWITWALANCKNPVMANH